MITNSTSRKLRGINRTRLINYLELFILIFSKKSPQKCGDFLVPLVKMFRTKLYLEVLNFEKLNLFCDGFPEKIIF